MTNDKNHLNTLRCSENTSNSNSTNPAAPVAEILYSTSAPALDHSQGAGGGSGGLCPPFNSQLDLRDYGYISKGFKLADGTTIDLTRGSVVLPGFFEPVDKLLVSRFANTMQLNEELFSFQFSNFSEYGCNDCGAHIYYPRFHAGKMHPLHSYKKSRKSASTLMDKFVFLKEHGADYLMKPTLTFPANFSEHEYMNGKLQRKIVKEYFKLVSKTLYGNAQLGVTYHLHLWKSSEPFAPHIHAHVSMPNLVYNKASQKFSRIKPNYTRDQLAILRKLWNKVLTNYGYGAGEVNLHHSFSPLPKDRNKKSKEIAQALHWFQYASRTASLDIWKFLNHENLSMLESGDYDQVFVEYMLSYSNRSYNLGFMSHLKKHGYIAVKHEMRCPFCNGFLEKEGNCECADVLVGKVPFLKRNRRGFESTGPPTYLFE